VLLLGGLFRTTEARRGLFWSVIAQIAMIDIVFSLDSVITAVSMVDQIGVMVAAVVPSVGVMLVAAHAEAFDKHVPKGYIYAAMAFSLLVESLNIRRRAKRPAKALQ
jgi:predicted tellurium resistance membrane protein TerC